MFVFMSVYGGSHIPWYMCVSQRINCSNQFFAFTLGILRMELNSLGLVASSLAL